VGCLIHLHQFALARFVSISKQTTSADEKDNVANFYCNREKCKLKKPKKFNRNSNESKKKRASFKELQGNLFRAVLLRNQSTFSTKLGYVQLQKFNSNFEANKRIAVIVTEVPDGLSTHL
jgi:hypothetical protein